METSTDSKYEPSEELLAFFRYIGETWTFREDPESGGIYAMEAHGVIMDPGQAKHLFDRMRIFFSHYGTERITKHNAGLLDRERNSPPVHYDPKDMRPWRMPGWIYVIKSPDGLYKIGKTKRKPDERLSEFIPKLPFDTEIVCLIQAENHSGFEAGLHQKFADKRVRGEWFRLDEKDIEYLKGLA